MLQNAIVTSQSIVRSRRPCGSRYLGFTDPSDLAGDTWSDMDELSAPPRTSDTAAAGEVSALDGLVESA